MFDETEEEKAKTTNQNATMSNTILNTTLAINKVSSNN